MANITLTLTLPPSPTNNDTHTISKVGELHLPFSYALLWWLMLNILLQQVPSFMVFWVFAMLVASSQWYVLVLRSIFAHYKLMIVVQSLGYFYMSSQHIVRRLSGFPLCATPTGLFDTLWSLSLLQLPFLQYHILKEARKLEPPSCSSQRSPFWRSPYIKEHSEQWYHFTGSLTLSWS